MRSIDSIFKTVIASVSGVATKALSKIMGVAILYYSMQSIYISDPAANDYSIWYSVSIALMVICAFLILIDMSYNLNRTIGLYAFSLGFNRIVRYSANVFDGERALYSVVALFMVGVACNFIITGFYFIRGSTRGRSTMQVSAGAMIFANILAMTLFFTDSESTISGLFDQHPDIFLMVIMYTLLIIMLSSESIRNTDAESIRSFNLRALGHTEACTERTFITAEDAEVLSRSFEDRSSWRNVNLGPIESEYCFRLIHGIHDNSFVRVQKWKDEAGLFFIISDRNTDTTVNAYRFRAEHIVLENGYLRIYGGSGERMRIAVGEAF